MSTSNFLSIKSLSTAFKLLYTISADKASIGDELWILKDVKKFEPNKKNEYYDELNYHLKQILILKKLAIYFLI